MLLETSFLTGLGLGLGNIRLGIELPVGSLLGIIVRESETGGSDGLKLGLFSRVGAGLLVVGGKKFQAGCIVGSVVEGDDGLRVVGEGGFGSGFAVVLFAVVG